MHVRKNQNSMKIPLHKSKNDPKKIPLARKRVRKQKCPHPQTANNLWENGARNPCQRFCLPQKKISVAPTFWFSRRRGCSLDRDCLLPHRKTCPGQVSSDTVPSLAMLKIALLRVPQNANLIAKIGVYT
jgi:hypothetical protein